MAYEIIYNSTDLTIERETVASGGTGTDEDPFIYPERRTWKQVLTDNPNTTDVFDDPAAQRIIDKIADFEALIDTIENAPATTTGNFAAQFDTLKAELPDLYRAVIFLGKRTLRGS